MLASSFIEMFLTRNKPKELLKILSIQFGHFAENQSWQKKWVVDQIKNSCDKLRLWTLAFRNFPASTLRLLGTRHEFLHLEVTIIACSRLFDRVTGFM